MSLIRWRKIKHGAMVLTPAKLNLFLEVEARRDDGFHQLTTLMCGVDWYDRLLFYEEQSGEDQLIVSGARLATGSENLVKQALQLLRESFDFPPQRVYLDKRIPMQAGLGGGSSNAAGTLCYLNQRYKLGLDSEALREYSAKLGSDVGFFVGQGAQVASGRGERLSPFSGQLFGGEQPVFVIVKPPLACSTAAVFQELTFPLTSPDGPLSFRYQGFSLQQSWRGSLFNRLQAAAQKVQPQLSDFVQEFNRSLQILSLAGIGGEVKMTGSGSAYFLPCSQRSAAQEFARKLRLLHSDWIVRVAVPQC